METAKTLNNTQRKVLAKLYEQKITQAQETMRRALRDEDQALETKLLKTDATAAKAVRLLYLAKEAAIKADSLIAEAQAEVRNSDFSVGGYSDSRSIDVSSSHPAMIAQSKEQDAKRAKLADASQRILTDIWGMTASYEEMVKHVDTMLKSILK